MSLCAYELQRERNIAENNRVLAALGLARPMLHAPLLLPQRVHKCEQKTRHESPSRMASLRPRAVDDDRNQKLTTSRKALMRLRVADGADISVPAEALVSPIVDPVDERPTRTHASKAKGKGGTRGGWNRGPYVGTALVRKNDRLGGSRIAIRQRADGRLYGYLGRQQLSFKRGEIEHLPCTFPCGVQVVSYTSGGSYDLSEAEQ